MIPLLTNRTVGGRPLFPCQTCPKPPAVVHVATPPNSRSPSLFCQNGHVLIPSWKTKRR
jgi:hypothetical protein